MPILAKDEPLPSLFGIFLLFGKVYVAFSLVFSIIILIKIHLEKIGFKYELELSTFLELNYFEFIFSINSLNAIVMSFIVLGVKLNQYSNIMIVFLSVITGAVFIFISSFLSLCIVSLINTGDSILYDLIITRSLLLLILFLPLSIFFSIAPRKWLD